jgi:hypothetical protein
MRSFVTFLALTFSTCIFAQKDKSFNINWHNKEHDNIKFKSSELQYSEKGKFYYNMSNDKENLYIDLKIFDQDVQRTVLASGLTFWINMDGKKVKKTGLRFPARQGSPDMTNMQSLQNQQNRMPGGGITPSGVRNMQKPPEYKIELIRLGGSDDSFITPNEANNFRGSFRFEPDGNMWYELIIPLSKLPERSSKKGNDKAFILGISYSAIGSRPGGGGAGAPDFGGEMGGPGGGGGMGGPGGGPGGGGGGRGGRSGGGAGEPGGGGADMRAPSSPSVLVWFKDLQFASER